MDSLGNGASVFVVIRIKDKMTYVEERMELEDGSNLQGPLKVSLFRWELQTLFLVDFREEKVNLRKKS